MLSRALAEADTALRSTTRGEPVQGPERGPIESPVRLTPVALPVRTNLEGSLSPDPTVLQGATA